MPLPAGRLTLLFAGGLNFLRILQKLCDRSRRPAQGLLEARERKRDFQRLSPYVDALIDDFRSLFDFLEDMVLNRRFRDAADLGAFQVGKLDGIAVVDLDHCSSRQRRSQRQDYAQPVLALIGRLSKRDLSDKRRAFVVAHIHHGLAHIAFLRGLARWHVGGVCAELVPDVDAAPLLRYRRLRRQQGRGGQQCANIRRQDRTPELFAFHGHSIHLVRPAGNPDPYAAGAYGIPADKAY